MLPRTSKEKSTVEKSVSETVLNEDSKDSSQDLARQTPVSSPKDSIHVEINTSALKSNLATYKGLCGDSRIMAVVKSNAYGHGAVGTARAVELNVDWFGVNSIAEAVELRDSGIQKPILIMGRNEANAYANLGAGMSLVLSTWDDIQELRSRRKDIAFHWKIDTGMSRLGVHGAPRQRILSKILEDEAIPIEGVMTHFANVEDVTDQSFALQQLNDFQSIVAPLKKSKPNLISHAAASAPAMILPQSRLDMVRIGISLYGLWASDATRLSAYQLYGELPKLAPALRFSAKIVHINTVPSGSYVGYGCTERVMTETKVAVLPVGYFEGYDRRLSNRSHVLIRGKRARLLGRVCMNMIMVDVTHIDGVSIHDEAVMIGDQQDEKITADELANLSGTINYEVVTRLQKDLPRQYTK